MAKHGWIELKPSYKLFLFQANFLNDLIEGILASFDMNSYVTESVQNKKNGAVSTITHHDLTSLKRHAFADAPRGF